jgi:Rv0078B-related antitoxin
VETSEPTNLEIALDLMDLGFETVAQRFRDGHPQATEAEVERLLCEWLLCRPGDAEGRLTRYPASPDRDWWKSLEREGKSDRRS